MKIYEKTTLLKCTKEELFDFHLDVSNLKRITPPDTKVVLLNEDFIPSCGEVLNIKTTKHFIPTVWRVKIEKLERPNILVDKALKSPFKFWEHSHIFTQKGEFCELKDVVKYELPFGIIGKLLNPFIQNELEKMFEFRHKVTKGILANKNNQ